MKFKLRFHVPKIVDLLIDDFRKSRAAEFSKKFPELTGISSTFQMETDQKADLMLNTVKKWVKDDGTIHLHFDTDSDTVTVVTTENH
jgi:hypothetical protein